MLSIHFPTQVPVCPVIHVGKGIQKVTLQAMRFNYGWTLTRYHSSTKNLTAARPEHLKFNGMKALAILFKP
jgi:hypothetical protein